MGKIKGEQQRQKRRKFELQPRLVQHSLFFSEPQPLADGTTGSEFLSIRGGSTAGRLTTSLEDRIRLGYENFKRPGNKRFAEGKHFDAMQLYEQCSALFVW